jgi:hypothetical protein
MADLGDPAGLAGSRRRRSFLASDDLTAARRGFPFQLVSPGGARLFVLLSIAFSDAEAATDMSQFSEVIFAVLSRAQGSQLLELWKRRRRVRRRCAVSLNFLTRLSPAAALRCDEWSLLRWLILGPDRDLGTRTPPNSWQVRASPSSDANSASPLVRQTGRPAPKFALPQPGTMEAKIDEQSQNRFPRSNVSSVESKAPCP